MTEPDAASKTPDFTIRRDPHQFRIDDDVFSAPAWLSPFALKAMANSIGKLGDLTNLTDVASVVAAIDTVGVIMAALMPGESGQRFKARLETEGAPGDPPPIDLMKQAIPALYYLLECYGLRPTVPSSSSSAGSTAEPTSTPNDGTSSTDGASATESTSPDSPSPTGSI